VTRAWLKADLHAHTHTHTHTRHTQTHTHTRTYTHDTHRHTHTCTYTHNTHRNTHTCTYTHDTWLFSSSAMPGRKRLLFLNRRVNIESHMLSIVEEECKSLNSKPSGGNLADCVTTLCRFSAHLREIMWASGIVGFLFGLDSCYLLYIRSYSYIYSSI